MGRRAGGRGGGGRLLERPLGFGRSRPVVCDARRARPGALRVGVAARRLSRPPLTLVCWSDNKPEGRDRRDGDHACCGEARHRRLQASERRPSPGPHLRNRSGTHACAVQMGRAAKRHRHPSLLLVPRGSHGDDLSFVHDRGDRRIRRVLRRASRLLLHPHRSIPTSLRAMASIGADAQSSTIRNQLGEGLRVRRYTWTPLGAVAQLGERRAGSAKATGSNPVGSTR